MKFSHRHIFKFLIALLLFLESIIFAQTVPIELQLQMLFKILKFDRNLSKKLEDDFIIAIIYQKLYRTSLNYKNQCEKYYLQNQPTINNEPVNAIFIDLEEQDLVTSLKEIKVDILYILPLRAYNLEKISTLCDEYDILSISADEEYLNNGISVAFSQVANKPQILINNESSKQEGTDFSSHLLKLVKIVK